MDKVATVLAELSTCLCAQLLTDDSPPVCACGLFPGAEVPMDYVGNCEGACGQAWVRLANAYPSTTIGVATQVPGNCGLGIGVDIELGIARCVEVGDVDGQPPDPAVLAAAAVLQEADMMTMWRAVACCRSSKDWIVTNYTPFGPEGGVVLGTLLVSILVT
jgi:hypothetical protein